MKTKDCRSLQDRAIDLEKVYTFSIMVTIKKHYDSLDQFKREYKSLVDGKADSKTQIEFCRRFKHTNYEYRKILGQIDGRYVSIGEVLPLMSKHIHYQKHFSKNYKSGKSFHVHSYWYLDFEVVESLWNSAEVLDAKSSFYTERQHRYIDKIILKCTIRQEDTTMTKREQAEKEQYDREYAEGKHLLTWEAMRKQERKNQRAAEKRAVTIEKKALLKVYDEYNKLKHDYDLLVEKCNRLEAVIAERKVSDIPESDHESMPEAVARPPEDDIPSDEELKRQEAEDRRRCPICQEWLQTKILEHKISVGFARSVMRAIVGEKAAAKLKFEEHKLGWDALDSRRTTDKRLRILKHLIVNSAYYKLSDDGLKYANQLFKINLD